MSYYKDALSNTLIARFALRDQRGRVRRGDFPVGFQDIDLLWSPDSKAFFVNGGNGGGYWGFWVFVYRLEDPSLQPIDLTRRAMRDMVATFPPCRASQLDREECLAIAKEPDYNMSGIDWVENSKSFIVMAEVPCSGGHGGIMCQVMGYEIEVPTGKILRRLTARQLAHTWQASMAWKFHIPDPPDYCTAENRQTMFGCSQHDW